MLIEDYNNCCVRYWIEVWMDLANKLEVGSLDDFASPHIIVRELMDEINFNELRNENIKKYLKEKINLFSKHEFIRNKPSWKPLKENIGEDSHYLLTVCENLLTNYFREELYFLDVFEQLKSFVLSNDLPAYKNEIKLYSLYIIAEFVLKGYGLKTIKSIPNKILSGYRVSGTSSSRFVHTDYPYIINRSKYAVLEDKNVKKVLLLKGYSLSQIHEISKNTYLDRFNSEGIDKYNQDLIAFINNLTLEERLQSITKIFFSPYQEYTFIFPIQGLRGKYDMKVGDVYFYCPTVKRYLNPGRLNGLSKDEFFGRSPNINPMNISVTVEGFDWEGAKYKAIKLANSSFDALNWYVSGRSKYYADSEICIALDSNKKPVFESLGPTKIQKEALFSIDLNAIESFIDKKLIEEETSFLNALFFESSIDFQNPKQKIAKAMHWFRKAEEADLPEDKLLNYWICIEGLIKFSGTDKGKKLLPNVQVSKPSEVASKLIAAISACHFLKNYFRKTYRRTLINIESQFLAQGSALPEDIKDVFKRDEDDIYSESNDKIRLFLDKLTDVKNYLDSELIKEEIDRIDSIKSNSKKAKECVQKQFDLVSQDVLLIYRLRNQIVHDAHYDNELLPFYVKKTSIYVRKLLLYLFLEVNKSDKSILEILMTRYHWYEKLINALELEISVDFLDEEKFGLNI